ncbi:unnamed protein product [Owenia fusiformis]|uniref:Uncharacterized protein n=1 Tax=Owenia fusiformis TaxID=6347 RepID=A0A8J1XLH2_OWEFU|nr:unnamed protein product [Owenia fusiformis]
MDSEEKAKQALSPEENIFEDMLNLALSVKEAREQADEAADKAHLVEELCRRAQVEAANIRKVAEDLTSTALGVAKIALSINKYQTFSDAYKSHPEFEKKIPLDELSEMLSGPNKKYDSMHSEKMVDSWTKSNTEECAKDKVDPAVQKPLPFSMTKQRRSSLPYTIEPDFRYRRNSKEEDPKRKHHSLPDRFHTEDDPSFKTQSNYNRDILREIDEKKTEKFTEKYPMKDASLEGKSSLVESFDSKLSLRTVWENGTETSMRPLITGGKNIGKAPESWAEKKVIQKMKLKLPKDSDEHVAIEYDEGNHDKLVEPFDKSPGYFKPILRQQNAKENETIENSDNELESIMFDVTGGTGSSASKQVQLIRTEMTSSNEANSPWSIPVRNRNNPRAISPLVVQEQDSIMVLSDDESQRQTTVVHHTITPIVGAISPLRPISPRQP